MQPQILNHIIQDENLDIILINIYESLTDLSLPRQT